MTAYEGSAVLKDGVWIITAEPHVMIRLKRTFGRAQQASLGVLEIKDTDEVCKDLEWFSQRYPIEFKPKSAVKRRARLYDQMRESVVLALGGNNIPQFELAEPPREYQCLAAGLVYARKRVLLADDVGLGKTVSAILVLSNPEFRPAAVVTLAHLGQQWADEIRRFAPQLTVHVAKTGNPEELIPKKSRKAAADLFPPKQPDVIILSYSKLARGWAHFLKGKIRALITDEVAELRHSDSQKYAAARELSASAVVSMGLSATPIYNMGAEIHAVIDAIAPNVLGSVDEFRREWCKQSDRVASPEALGTFLRDQGLMLRRTRADVGRELPAISRIPYTIDADEEVLNEVKGSAVALAKIILGHSNHSNTDRWRASEQLDMIMRQATGIAKARYVAAFVRMMVESGESVVLYGWHRTVYDIWLEELKDFAPVMITGTESVLQKEESKKAFIEGRSKVVIISLRAGSGIDGFQKCCRTVVFGELDWAFGQHEQAEGRVYRDGQGDKVLVYYLISDAPESSDPPIIERLGIKRSQLDGLRDPHADIIEKLSQEGGTAKELARRILQRAGLDFRDEVEDEFVDAPDATCDA